MSDITNCVFHVSHSQTVGIQLIEAKVWGQSEFGHDRHFCWIDPDDNLGVRSGFGDDVYLMASGPINPADVADWFMDLPWGQDDEAVLSISGNDRGYVCIRGENGRAERTEWFT